MLPAPLSIANYLFFRATCIRRSAAFVPSEGQSDAACCTIRQPKYINRLKTDGDELILRASSAQSQTSHASHIIRIVVQLVTSALRRHYRVNELWQSWLPNFVLLVNLPGGGWTSAYLNWPLIMLRLRPVVRISKKSTQNQRLSRTHENFKSQKHAFE